MIVLRHLKSKNKVMKNLILAVCLLMGVSINAEAQLLKKLKDKIVDKNKTEETTEERDTGDDTPGMNFGGAFGMGSISDLPDSYDFDWRYDLLMTDHKGEEMPISYFLKDGSDYLGMRYKDNKEKYDMQSVMDFGRKVMAIFMHEDDRKTVMVTKMDIERVIEQANEAGYVDDMQGKITSLPDKVILGYTCKGYQVEDEDGTTKMYVATDAPVGFFDMFSGSKLLPKNMNKDWMKHMATGLFMEMEYLPKKKKKQKMKLVCTALEKENKTISKAGYQSATGM